MTPTGNPQNILVASLSGMAYLDFLRALFPVAFLGLALQVGLLALLYPEARSLRPLPPPPPLRYRLHPGLLRKGLLVASGLLLAFLLGYPMAQGALVAAGLLLFTRRLRSERYFMRVDWELLVMFGGLFVLTEGVRRLGLAEALLPLASSPLGLLLAATLLSLLISNVPAVLLLAPWPRPRRSGSSSPGGAPWRATSPCSPAWRTSSWPRGRDGRGCGWASWSTSASGFPSPSSPWPSSTWG